MEIYRIHDSARVRLGPDNLFIDTLEDGVWGQVDANPLPSGSGLTSRQWARYFASCLAKGKTSKPDLAFISATIERGRYNTTERAIGYSNAFKAGEQMSRRSTPDNWLYFLSALSVGALEQLRDRIEKA